MDRDRARFKEVVRGRIREDLQRYLASTELIGKRGDRAVSVPVPSVELPRFRFGANEGGVGQGPGEVGDAADGSHGDADGGAGGAGEQEGAHIMEAEVELEELAAMLGEELGLPNILPRGKDELDATGGQWSGIRSHGPQSLRHFRRTFRRALARTIASGEFDPAHPVVTPIPDDLRYRALRPKPRPESSAVIMHMMDVSGSMGREQKDIVRIEAFWIDTWLRSQYRNLEVVYIVHDAGAKVVDKETFFHLRESGGTKISSAYELCLDLIKERYHPDDYNIYPFHYSDGDNWSARDTERCVTLVRDELLPRVNQFCYGQVKSAYGSGQFKHDLDAAFQEECGLVTAGVDDRGGIPGAIKAFLGQGR
ncbi:MAG: DUF444 family protein [Planctomycetota bacterium]|nr:DUF444 family protein [Planctomycetota bacterium]MDG1984005.1 DUF444 family protein [Planctomycetota bacterium]